MFQVARWVTYVTSGCSWLLKKRPIRRHLAEPVAVIPIAVSIDHYSSYCFIIIW